MALKFEWDQEKAGSNLSKHKVSFDEASTVFADPLAKIFFDQDHWTEETREIIVGHSILGRLLLVSFTERGRDLVRIISARAATRKERKSYEENQDG
ncbi:MAG: BrnT family toxin [Isosphaeraceae bacterium]|jgi:uncharacterized DUF497 family protein